MYLDSVTKLNTETHSPRHISAKFSKTCFIIAIAHLRWIQKQAKYVSVGKVVRNNPCHYFFKDKKNKTKPTKTKDTPINQREKIATSYIQCYFMLFYVLFHTQKHFPHQYTIHGWKRKPLTKCAKLLNICKETKRKITQDKFKYGYKQVCISDPIKYNKQKISRLKFPISSHIINKCFHCFH